MDVAGVRQQGGVCLWVAVMHGRHERCRKVGMACRRSRKGGDPSSHTRSPATISFVAVLVTRMPDGSARAGSYGVTPSEPLVNRTLQTGDAEGWHVSKEGPQGQRAGHAPSMCRGTGARATGAQCQQQPATGVNLKPQLPAAAECCDLLSLPCFSPSSLLSFSSSCSSLLQPPQEARAQQLSAASQL